MAALATTASRPNIEAMIPVVRSIVHRKFANTPEHVDREDLFQAGMEGVCQAARRWRANGGADFITWAWYRAYDAIRDHLRQQMFGTRGKPWPDPVSLDRRHTGNTGATHTFADTLPAKPDSHDRLLWHEIRRLPPLQARAVKLTALGYTLAEIASIDGVTEAAICKQLAKGRRALEVRQ